MYECMATPRVEFHRSHNYDDAIGRAAAENRISYEYFDIFGKRHDAGVDTRARILAALGWDVSSLEAVDNRRRHWFRDEYTWVVPASSVIAQSRKVVPLTLPDSWRGSVCFDVHLEHGGQISGSVDLDHVPLMREVSCEGESWRSYELWIPAETPLGYHRLRVTRDGRELASSALIVCPERAYVPERRMAGFNVTLYGLRSRRNWGCGDFSDLRLLIDWAASTGFSFIGLNPLHALHNRVPYNTSPYLPLSLYYKNLLYIDVEAVPEFARCDFAQRLLASGRTQAKLRHLRESEFLAYSEVDQLKKRFLKVLYRQFRRKADERRRRAFYDYCDREGDLLQKFALYCALDEVLHKQDRNRWTWRQWPAEYQSPDTDACRRFAQDHWRLLEFYKYIQFVIEEQLSAAQNYAKERGLAAGLYHDLALATDSCGSDLWAHGDFYVKGCRVGAPPDDFSPSGQDWAFPPPSGEAHRRAGYYLYRESIRKVVSHGGALRIDHVMRLIRLFWIPDGNSAANGTYVYDFAEDLMRILALESVRSGNIIVGEDLGTVTDEMRDMLARFGILSYRLFYFEKHKDGRFKGSAEYPHQALVASSTHDLATMTGFWLSRDIEARRSAGLADDASYRDQIEDRRREKQHMLDVLHDEHLLPNWYTRNADEIRDVDGDLHNATVAFLSRVPSLLLLLNQEDLTKETDQQNLPGSTAEYPNWQRKMRLFLEELNAPEWQPFAAMFRYQMDSNGRS